MNRYALLWASLFLSVNSPTASGQTQTLAPGDKEPLLQIEAGGPTSYVTALAFSPDGKTLYSGGWDKVVRVWNLDPGGRFVLDRVSYRVPIGPGLTGAINALAVSADGDWLAVAGLGVARQGAGFRQRGWVVPSAGGVGAEMRKDQGTIYLFSTRNQTVRLLRGHLGPVLSLAFAPVHARKPMLSVSAAREWDEQAETSLGTVRRWDVDHDQYLDGPG